MYYSVMSNAIFILPHLVGQFRTLSGVVLPATRQSPGSRELAPLSLEELDNFRVAPCQISARNSPGQRQTQSLPTLSVILAEKVNEKKDKKSSWTTNQEKL